MALFDVKKVNDNKYVISQQDPHRNPMFGEKVYNVVLTKAQYKKLIKAFKDLLDSTLMSHVSIGRNLAVHTYVGGSYDYYLTYQVKTRNEYEQIILGTPNYEHNWREKIQKLEVNL